MKIEQIEIRGYRSFRDAVWRPGNLNLLVGPNASGKTNLLRALEFLRAIAHGQVAALVHASGGIVPLLWNHEAPAIEWSVALNQNLLTNRPSVLEFSLTQLLGSSYVVAWDVLGDETVRVNREADPSHWYYWRDRESAFVRQAGRDGLVAVGPPSNANESLLCQIPGSGSPLANLELYPQASAIRFALSQLFICQGINTARNSPIRLPVTTQYARQLEPDGANLASVLHTLYTDDREFHEKIDEAMRAAFGNEYVELVFQPAAAQMIQLAVQWRSSKRPHAGQELSDGTLRFLFLIAVLASPDPAPLVAIDEPEVGLHPSMFPIIAEYAAEAAGRTQIVLASHSPEFLDAFSEFEPDVTVCHWDAGQTRLRALSSGSLSRWLERYRLGHLFTRGDLDALAASDGGDSPPRLAAFPPEGAPLPPQPSSPEGAGS